MRQQSSQQRRSQFFSRSERTRVIWTVIAATLLVAAAALKSKAADLTPETLKAWNAYIQTQNTRGGEYSQSSYLWSDESPDRMRRLRDGEILIGPVGENPRVVRHGLIHHWIGAVFLPGTTLNDVLTAVRDYDDYKKFFAPNVVDSRLVHHSPSVDTFSLVMLNKAVVTSVALDVDLRSSYIRLDNNRAYSVGYSTSIHEIEAYRQPDQTELPENTGHGFIWRLYNISRFAQRDGGVYVELEAIALSRDVPPGLRWLVSPVVRRACRGSLLVSLQKTEAAILASTQTNPTASATNGIPPLRGGAFVPPKDLPSAGIR